MQLPRLLPDDGDGPSPVLLAELRALLRERQILRGRLDSQDAELARLRALLEEQQARLADLQERLRLAEKAATELALEDVVGSVVDSIEKGSAELTGRTVGSARAELRAALRIGRDGTGLTLADPLTAPSALSTVAFDLHPLPPTTIEQQTTTALAAVRQALLVSPQRRPRRLPPSASSRPLSAGCPASYAPLPNESPPPARSSKLQPRPWPR